MKYHRHMNKIRMRNQLVLLFLGLIILTVSTISIFLINRTRYLLEESSTEVHSRVVKQTAANINSSISSIDNYYQFVLSNRTVLKGLLDEDFGSNSETYDAVIDLKDLMFSLIKSNEGLESALYISKQGTVVVSSGGFFYPDFFQSSLFNQNPYIQDIYSNPSVESWYVDDTLETGSIYYLRGIRNPFGGDTLGVLSFLLKDSFFLDEISSLSSREGGFYICDNQGYIFLHSNPEKTGSYVSLDLKYIERQEPFIIEKGETLFVGYPTENSWFVISEIPKDTLYKDLEKITRWGILISFAFIFFGSFLSLYIANVYTGDLTVLVEAMGKSSPGNLEAISINGSNREIQSLALTYNSMIDKLNKLTVDLKDEIVDKTKVEQALRLLNETLETKVSERTAQLEESLETLKETQTSLIEREKMASLGSLVAGVAHEINTPVGVCITASSHHDSITADINKAFSEKSLTMSAFSSYLEKSKSISSIINTNLGRVATLIRSFKKVSVDQILESKQTIGIKEYIQNIMVSLSPEIKNTDIDIICSDTLILTTYPGALAQIFTNLVMNSQIHGFTNGHRGEIQITIEEKADIINFVYRDNGAGMDEETSKHIFEPFFTTKRAQGGTGLGMHIVYNLVTQQLQGQITCTSIPGFGTTFTLVIPRSTENLQSS